jgi:hypothetical protein
MASLPTPVSYYREVGAADDAWAAAAGGEFQGDALQGYEIICVGPSDTRNVMVPFDGVAAYSIGGISTEDPGAECNRCLFTTLMVIAGIIPMTGLLLRTLGKITTKSRLHRLNLLQGHTFYISEGQLSNTLEADY